MNKDSDPWLSRLRVLAITDRRLCGGTPEALLRRCALLLEAGLPALMLREKDLDARTQFELAAALRRRTAAHGALFLVNDRLDVAMAVHADGAQLGRTALPVVAARRVGPHPFLLGASCHDAHELDVAEAGGADFALLSPVFAPTSHAADLEPHGVARFQELAAGRALPAIALGGITAQLAADLRSAGAAGAAAIGAFFSGTEQEAVEQVRAFIRVSVPPW